MVPADVDATVLVIGGGPVGLVLAASLAAQGIDVMVVERRTDVQPSPAAHVVNARTFEILRSLGVDAARLDAACRPPSDGAWVRWVTTLVGNEHGAVPFERQHDLAALDDITPTPLRNLSQHRLEPILRDHVASLPHCTVEYGVAWSGATDDGDTVTSTVVTDDGTAHRIRSRYLIGADGAGSPVRRACGIEMEGPTRLSSIVAIHARADLRNLVADRPATLYWITDPDHEGVLVAHDIDETWVLMHPYDPDVEDVESFSVERCRALFAHAVGAPVDFEVVGVSPWTMTCQVASHYRAGRVFLVGDAAHRFPPTGGLGLNTGAADAQNLAWKIAAVERGWAPESLLDTYERERRPVAEHNAEQSLDNAVRLFEVQAALASDDADEITASIERQAGHFDMLGLQLGAVYGGDGALVDDGTPVERADEPVRDYLPTIHPGARLPHVWIESDGRRCSTLDLVRAGRFALLTANEAWVDAARTVSHLVPLDVWRATDAFDLGDGAVLVRPDQHVAWRTTAAPVHDTQLCDAIDRLLFEKDQPSKPE